MEPAQGEITSLLAKWRSGEPSAFEQLISLVCPHLRPAVAAYIKRERNSGESKATALVDEVCPRLIGQEKPDWTDRAHFYMLAAKVMRMVPTDHARNDYAQKRGRGVRHVPLNKSIPWVSIGSASLIDFTQSLATWPAVP